MKKKIFGILLIGTTVISLTGCGNEVTKVEEKAKNKVLTCSFSHYNREIVDEVSFIYDSEGKSFSKATMRLIANLDDLQNSFVKKIKEAEDLSTLCSEHTDAPLKKCDAKLDGDTFTANMDIDIDKMDDDQKNTSIDELKKYLEDNSTESSVITCTIEEK